MINIYLSLLQTARFFSTPHLECNFKGETDKNPPYANSAEDLSIMKFWVYSMFRQFLKYIQQRQKSKQEREGKKINTTACIRYAESKQWG